MYRCLVCGRIIKSNRPDALIDHLRHEHPFINVDRPHQQHRRQNYNTIQNQKPCLPCSPRGAVMQGACTPALRSCPPACPLPQVARGCPPCPRPMPACPVPPPCPPCNPTCCPSRPCGPCGPCPPQPCPPPAPQPVVPCPTPCAVQCNPPTQADYCRAMREQTRRERRTKYKCTVESWKPGATKVVCPCCGCEAQPVIRRQKNQLASSSLTACLMMGCWPLQCLPFLLCESNVVNLYCAQCNNFLGAYNRRLGCIMDVEANLCNPGVVPNFPSIP